MSAIKTTNIQKYKSGSIEKGSELSKSAKRNVLKALSEMQPRIDFSGGNPVLHQDDLDIIMMATELLPTENVSVSLCGCELTKSILSVLKRVESVDITVDSPPQFVDDRPEGYNEKALTTVKRCLDEGIETCVATVLRRGNMSKKRLRELYDTICDFGVSEWQLLRFYPVGRATSMTKYVPSEAEYLDILEYINRFNGRTKVKLQHSLQSLVEPVSCPAVKEAIGILPNGEVMACPWALDTHMKPLHDKFRLGNVQYSTLDMILGSEKANIWRRNNAYHCRTLAFTEASLGSKYGTEEWFVHEGSAPQSWVESLLSKRSPYVHVPTGGVL